MFTASTGKRLTVAAMAAVFMITGLTACRSSVHNEEQPEPCLATDKHVQFSVDLFTAAGDAKFQVPFHLTLAIESPDPTYAGILWLETDTQVGDPIMTGQVTRNPIDIDKFTPYGAQLCWPADKVVAVLVRAYLIRPESVIDVAPGVPHYDTYDKFQCEIEDMANQGDDPLILTKDETRVELVDMISENYFNPFGDPTRKYRVGVQCIYTYLPGGYTGPAPDVSNWIKFGPPDNRS